MNSLKSFRIKSFIGAGGYGVVHSAIGPDGQLVAIKRELASDKVNRPNLQHEYNVLKALAGHESIPNASHTALWIMLTPCLQVELSSCPQLNAIQYIHSQGFIHRDIKPSNFVLGRGYKSHVVHLVDFGLTRRWRTVTDETPAALRAGGRIIGTPHYVSTFTHLGQEQTRRDDLHALTYTILFLVCGSLPWSCVKGGTKEHSSRRILEKKRSWTAARLCEDLPNELQLFSSHCLCLAINEVPDYQTLRTLLATLAIREGCSHADLQLELQESYARPCTPSPSLSEVPIPSVKRGDVILLKLNSNKTPDYEHPPRCLDPSFFPHQLSVPKRGFPYRPAVVRSVATTEDDPTYFSLEVYPITRRSNLEGLSTHRRSCFQQLEMVVENATGNPTASIQAMTSIPDHIFTTLERRLSGAKNPYRLTYDSDDVETRNVFKRLPKRWLDMTAVMDMRPCDLADLAGEKGVNVSGCNGWISEMTLVHEIRKHENEMGDDTIATPEIINP
ncbi:kinase-like domain-containing protein [Cyathus striatus]|nr:kinase-like domain-containing protein [Cyathus striatus]